MPLGVLFAFLAYGIYACGDALIKSFSHTPIGVFEIGFFTTLFSLVPAALTKPKGERWRLTFQMKHPWLLQLRALAGVAAAALVMYSFTHIPLAETYSIVFLTPVFVVVVSVLVLKEHVSPKRWFLLAVSFLGVLLVVRPGFRDLQLGHLTAVLCAFCASINTTVLRKIATEEKRVSLVGVVAAYALAFNGVMMIPSFVMPTLDQIANLMLIGACGGTGHLLFIAANRRAPASQVAPTQYSQIIWAIVLGALFYKELPDPIAIGGLVVIIAAGILNVVDIEPRIRSIRRFSVVTTPPPEVAATAATPPVGASRAES